MTKIVRLGSVGETINQLNRKFEQDEIEGLVVCIKNKDGTFDVAWADLSYIERLGLLEAAKGDCHYAAFCPYCE